MNLRILLMATLVAIAPAAAAGPAWITVGERAYLHLQQAALKLTLHGSGAAVPDTENRYLVEVNEDDLDKVTAIVHTELKHCGGFMFHPDEAAGRRALAREDATVLPGLAKPGYAIANQALVTAVLAQMEEGRIGKTIVDLSAFTNRYYATTHGAAASNWLSQQWSAMTAQRRDVSVEQVSHAGYGQKSVMATIQGSDTAAGIVVLGAHLDSINVSSSGEGAIAPGADDDASGVAGLTEVLRVLVANNYRPRRTIKLIGYAAEEVGLRGSQDIARGYKKSGVDVAGVLQLDMTNYKGSSKDIYLISDYTDAGQNDFLARLIAAYLPALSVGYDKCGYACSDHASWNAQGYPTSMPFEATLAQDNRAIHTKNDTYANSGSQATHALKFARAAAAYAIELGSDTAPPKRNAPLPGPS